MYFSGVISSILFLIKGFGYLRLGWTLGWADPETRSSFGYIHNRFVTQRFFDMELLAGLAGTLCKAIVAARHQDPREVPPLDSIYKPVRPWEPSPGHGSARGCVGPWGLWASCLPPTCAVSSSDRLVYVAMPGVVAAPYENHVNSGYYRHDVPEHHQSRRWSQSGGTAAESRP